MAALPDRLREVLSLIAQGLSDDDIATRLGITRNTVRNHVTAIYDRLGIRKRSRRHRVGARAWPGHGRQATDDAREKNAGQGGPDAKQLDG